MITAKNLVCHELIGLPISVARHSDRSMIGISGIAVDETKNSLVIETRKGEKRVPKRMALFRFNLEGKEVDVDGDLIAMQPEDRTKKLWRYCR